jgi:tetratricopeptide (TPR) repeat protein
MGRFPVIYHCLVAGSLALLMQSGTPASGLDPLNPGSQADAAYTNQREFTSPVTGETFWAPVLKQNVRVGSYDYDRCPHPPLNTLAYVLVIDPATGYVAYPDAFDQPCPWTADDLKRILGEPKFNRPAPAELPWTGAYAWEKMENAARLAEAAQQRALDVANWYLQAAWAVRLDVVSGDNVFDNDVFELFARFPARPPDKSDLLKVYELQLADYWDELRSTGQLNELSDSEFALALAWLYRSRGELIPAEQWLRKAALADASVNAEGSLYNYLWSSVELERTYLRLARDELKIAWEKQEVSPANEGIITFQLGEIERRLGDFPSALYWYDQAQAKNRGSVNSDMVLRQRKLVDGGRGY